MVFVTVLPRTSSSSSSIDVVALVYRNSLNYTESLNEEVLDAVIGYEVFYRRNNRLRRTEVQSCIISAHTPTDETLKRLGFTVQIAPGVYGHECDVLKDKRLIVVNKLPNEPHNAPLKVFGLRLVEREAGVRLLEEEWADELPEELVQLAVDLLVALRKGEGKMIEMTTDDIIQLEQEFPRLMGRLRKKYMRENPELFVVSINDEDMVKHIEQIRQEGLQEGQQQMLRMLLTERFGAVPLDLSERIQHLSSDQMQAVVQVIMQAPSLDAVLEQLPAVAEG